jgi:hypothetical protein
MNTLMHYSHYFDDKHQYSDFKKKLKCFQSNLPMTVSLISTTTRFNTTMAQYNKSTSSRQSSTASTAVVNPFCKVCKDAGKPESEYTSHFVKDKAGPNGKVVCPTLLSQACRICKETGHTSSYCSQYRPRDNLDRGDREAYRPRDDRPRDDPRGNARDISFNRLREDTERHERDIYERDVQYHRQQERQSKPWLQAVTKPAAQQYGSSSNSRRAPAAPARHPYAHPHGPRVRLELETRALSAVAAAPEEVAVNLVQPVVDIRQVNLGHSSQWGDEDTGAEMQFQEFVKFVNTADDNKKEDSKKEVRYRESYITREEDDLLTMSLDGGFCFSSDY